MIIFAVFLRAFEVGCFLGGRWDGVRRWLGGEAKKKRRKGEGDIWEGGWSSGRGREQKERRFGEREKKTRQKKLPRAR